MSITSKQNKLSTTILNVHFLFRYEHFVYILTTLCYAVCPTR